jgi:hypothetical protein
MVAAVERAEAAVFCAGLLGSAATESGGKWEKRSPAIIKL